MLRILHITPELPPSVGGVADYTSILSCRLTEVTDESIDVVLVRAGRDQGPTPDVTFPCADLGGRESAPALAETIRRLVDDASGPTVVLLEYSGYGYSEHGAPLWLLRGLQHVCKGEGLPLVTIFHELYATSSKPWERAFWTMPLQWMVTSGLARLSDGVMTNRTDAAQWLRRHGGGGPLCMSPTFSNVGEPEEVLAYEKRDPYAVLFGGQGMKRRLFDQDSESIDGMLAELGVEWILDIGPNASLSDFSLAIPIEQRGVLPAAEISELLKNASAGLLRHSLHCLTKSGIWASYAAHGIPPLIAGNGHASEGLVNGKHYLRLEREHRRGNPENHLLPSIARNVHEWYETEAHSSQTARHLIDLLVRALHIREEVDGNKDTSLNVKR